VTPGGCASTRTEAPEPQRSEAVDRLCDRVRDLETALDDLIEESLRRDNRGPQPALQRAISALRPATRPADGRAIGDTDWLALGRELYDALGVVARERLDLHGDAAYGEALRMTVAAGRLVTVEAHRAAVARSDRVAEGNRVLIEMAERRRLAEVSELRRTMSREIAERLAGLADEVRARAEREKLSHHVRRGALLAAEWLAAPAARLAAADERWEACSR